MRIAPKSRFFMLHRGVNAGKVSALEALHAEYRAYVALCVQAMLAARQYKLTKGQMQAFFPKAERLTSQIQKNARSHAVALVNSWVKSVYVRKLKRLIKGLKKDGQIDAALAKQLFTVGKFLVTVPAKNVTQEAIDLYWRLFDEKGGNPPEVRDSLPMWLCQETAHLTNPRDATTANCWLQVSTLRYRKVIQLPLVGGPYVRSAADVGKGILARKTKRGRWRFEALDRKEFEVPEPSDLPADAEKVGVDVGLNVLAATSNGDLLGASFKPKFERLYRKVQTVRSNRFRQGLRRNSRRLDRLESRLTGMIRTATGTCANWLVVRYPETIFVLEDLNLSGCRGSKRFAYRALAHALESKAATETQNPAYTSQECPSCGYINANNRGGTKFHCRSCGRIAHADVVGGTNLLGRSEDNQIGPDDRPWEVREVLRARYRLRRDSALGPSLAAPVPSGRRLTTRGLGSPGAGTASNLGWHPLMPFGDTV